MIILKNIYKKYLSSRKYTLKDINLCFKSNGLVSILGESGSGKTTLLNIISGLDKPTKGSIYIDNIDINELIEDNSLYNQYIGFVFQDYNLIDNLSVYDNINLINNKNIDSILRKLKLLKKKNSVTGNISGGEKQRVAIARAISKDKKIIICDEPTGALDSATSESIMKILKNLSKDKLVIMVTHNKELANLYSDRIITIKDGIIESDTNEYIHESRKSNYKKVRNSYSLTQIIKLVIKNIRSKKKRNVLTIISLIIGITSLLSVLAISNGFKVSLDYEEKNSLSTYPIYISETSTNITNELSNIFKDDINNQNKIINKFNKHQNTIDNDLINYLDNNKNTNYILKKYLINNILLSKIDKNIKDEVIMKKGFYPTTENELLLIVDDNNYIDKSIINFELDEYQFSDLINYEIYINNNKYYISGIATFKEDSTLYNETGIFTLSNLDTIPIEIYLYPKDYNNKIKLLDYLNKYDNLEYTDYSDTVKDVTTKIVDAISIVLIVFSIITLIVSTIMIYILTLISIMERTKVIGIYKVNGINNLIIKFIFYLENIILTIISIIISICILYLMSIPLNNTLYTITGLNNIMLISPDILLKPCSLIISIITLSTLIPLRLIDKLNIVETTKYNY